MTLSPERRKHIIRVICDLYGYDMEYAINHTLALAEQADEGRCILCIEHDEPCDDCVADATKACPDCGGSGKVIRHVPECKRGERPQLSYCLNACKTEPCHCTKGEIDE